MLALLGYLTQIMAAANYGKYGSSHYVRCFQLLENCFPPFNSSAGASGTGDAVSGETSPKIGNIMYSDLTYGSADDYDGSKTAMVLLPGSPKTEPRQ